MCSLMASKSPITVINMIGILSMAGIQEIDMEVYAGLFLVALSVAYFIVRAFQLRSTSSVSKEEVAASTQKQFRSHGRKLEGNAGLSAHGSRFNPAKKPMKMARRSSVINAGAIQKPWGW